MSTGFWESLRIGFLQLRQECAINPPSAPAGRLTAIWRAQPPPGEWELSYWEGVDGYGVTKRFEWHAQSAAARLGFGETGQKAVWFWLDRVRSDAPESHLRPHLIEGSDGDGQLFSVEILDICGLSADYCRKCEADEMTSREAGGRKDDLPQSKPIDSLDKIAEDHPDHAKLIAHRAGLQESVHDARAKVVQNVMDGLPFDPQILADLTFKVFDTSMTTSLATVKDTKSAVGYCEDMKAHADDCLGLFKKRLRELEPSPNLGDNDLVKDLALRLLKRLEEGNAAAWKSVKKTAEADNAGDAPQLVGTDRSKMAAGPAEDNAELAKGARAVTVAKLIKELNHLKPQMFEDESEYNRLRDIYPDFLTFRIAEHRPDLKRKILGIRFSARHIRLAQELAAAHHGRQLSTIQEDWKNLKPTEFKRPK